MLTIGAALATSLGFQADVPAPLSHPANQARGEPAEPAPQDVQFLDADGNPLPPDIQRDLKKQLQNSLPRAEDGEPAKPMGSSAAPSTAIDGDIVVSAQRPRGSVVGEIPPERTFGPLEIDAYGASNIRELIDTLGPQVSSTRGEGANPVTLLNGRRVSSFSEIAEIPTEAIERMEVFPEELALRYGYRPGQKVVNIVTFERFSSRLGQLGASLPTEGGYNAESVQANYFAIRGNTRLDFGAEYKGAAALAESDRGLAQLGGTPDAGRFRTLLPKTERLAINGLISRNLVDDVSSTLNGRYEASEIRDLLGRGESGTLARDIDTRNAHLGTTLHGEVSKWLWTFTGNYDHLGTEVATDMVDAFGARDRARSVNAFANANLVLSGSLLKLPAGPLSTTIRGGVELRDFSSTSLRGSADQQVDLSRDSGAFQINLNMPIFSRRSKNAALPGDLSVNANVELERLSDFGTLRTFGYGLNWSISAAFNFIVSATTEQSAPTMEQLGAPLLITPNVRTFDFTRQEVVDTTQISGGNPELRFDDRSVLRIGLNAKPISNTDLTFSVDYVSTRVEHPIASFPIVTPEIEAAFPERFTRDTGGRLVQIDGRPLNFEKADQEQLRWGVSFVRPLGAVEPWMRTAPVRTFSSEAEARAAAPVGSLVTMVQPGSAMARRMENMASRLYVSFYHTWQLQDTILARSGLPVLDLLNGAAIDILGGRRRHQLELQAGVFKKGVGGRVTVNWQSGTTLRNLGGEAGDLSFSDLVTFNINLFANLEDHLGGPKAPRWLKGTRVTFGITNLLNTRQQVRDRLGSTPLSYQPAYLDPLGRLISFGLRKTF